MSQNEVELKKGTFPLNYYNSLCKKTSNHHANLPLEMYSFTLWPPGKHLETTGADDPTLWLSPSL